MTEEQLSSQSQQPRPNPKGKAAASIVLGFIAAILPFAILLPELTSPHAGGVIGGILSIFGPLLILAIIAGLIVIILGIMGLKPTKGNLALVGVILGIIALLFELLYLFLFLPSPQ